MPKTSAGPRPRHIPQRTCIACRSTEAKRGLIRVVRTPEGRVELDAGGKKNGRGAYVHESPSCWDEALKKDRLGRALKADIAPNDMQQLVAHAATVTLADRNVRDADEEQEA